MTQTNPYQRARDRWKRLEKAAPFPRHCHDCIYLSDSMSRLDLSDDIVVVKRGKTAPLAMHALCARLSKYIK